MEYIIRRYKEDDKEKILKLFEKVHGDALARQLHKGTSEEARKHWNWQFERNPYNTEEYPLIWIAEHDDRIVGQWASMPIKLKINDTYVDSAWCVDVMVHPDYERQGIAKELVLQMEKSVNLPMILGISKVGLVFMRKKINWMKVGTSQPLVKIINTKKILAKYIKNEFVLNLVSGLGNSFFRYCFPVYKFNTKELSFEEIKVFNEEFNIFFEKVSKFYPVIVKRDKDYLNWRYINHPNYKYTVFVIRRLKEILGFVVLRIKRKENGKIGMIVDLLAYPHNKNIMLLLIKESIEFFTRKGCDYIQTIIFDKQIEKILKKNGFIKIKKGFGRPFLIYTDNCSIPKSYFTNKEKIFFTWGDSDGEL